jgi:hypothetical protein
MPVRFDHAAADFIDQTWDILVLWRLEHNLTGPDIADPCRSGSEAPGARPEVTRENAVLNTDEQLAIPFEQSVVRPSLDKSHGVSVAQHQRLVASVDLVGRVAGKGSGPRPTP